MSKEIPQKIRMLFGKEYEIKFIGMWKDAEVYDCYIPNCKTGIPAVCLLKDNGVEQLTAFDALDVINELVKE